MSQNLETARFEQTRCSFEKKHVLKYTARESYAIESILRSYVDPNQRDEICHRQMKSCRDHTRRFSGQQVFNSAAYHRVCANDSDTVTFNAEIKLISVAAAPIDNRLERDRGLALVAD